VHVAHAVRPMRARPGAPGRWIRVTTSDQRRRSAGRRGPRWDTRRARAARDALYVGL